MSTLFEKNIYLFSCMFMRRRPGRDFVKKFTSEHEKNGARDKPPAP